MYIKDKNTYSETAKKQPRRIKRQPAFAKKNARKNANARDVTTKPPVLLAPFVVPSKGVLLARSLPTMQRPDSSFKHAAPS